MELGRLRIDRSGGARGGGAGRSGRSGRARRRRIIGWAVALIVLGGVGFVLRYPLGRFYDRIALPAVEIARAVRSTPREASAVAGTAANGYIVAARRAALSADTPGRIVEMNVEEGSVVRQGDVVARLYADEYRALLRRAEAELTSAEATVARRRAELAAAKTTRDSLESNVAGAKARVNDAEAQLRQAELDYRRAEELVKKGADVQQLADDARTRRDSAQAALTEQQARLVFAEGRVREAGSQVEVAAAAVAEAASRLAVLRAARDEAQATLDKTEVRAPFDGVVVLKDAEVGEVVSPNSQGANSRGSVVTMVDFRSLEVQVDLPETVLAAVDVGTPAAIFLDAFPERRYDGIVSRIWPTANRQKGSIELRVRFDEPDQRLRPEMGVRVVFSPEKPAAGPKPATPETGVVLIPENCLVRANGALGVFELERDRAIWRAVETGERSGGRVVVRRGLDGGEKLVADPPADLEDGARVRVLR